MAMGGEQQLAVLARFSSEISGALTNPYFQSYRPIGDANDPALLLVCRLELLHDRKATALAETVAGDDVPGAPVAGALVASGILSTNVSAYPSADRTSSRGSMSTPTAAIRETATTTTAPAWLTEMCRSAPTDGLPCGRPHSAHVRTTRTARAA